MEVRARAKMMMAMRTSRRESPFESFGIVLKMEVLFIENAAIVTKDGTDRKKKEEEEEIPSPLMGLLQYRVH